MDFVHLHSQALGEAGRFVERIDPRHFEDPTPYQQWDVRTLLNHLVRAAAYLTGDTPPDRKADSLGGDQVAAWRCRQRWSTAPSR